MRHQWAMTCMLNERSTSKLRPPGLGETRETRGVVSQTCQRKARSTRRLRRRKLRVSAPSSRPRSRGRPRLRRTSRSMRTAAGRRRADHGCDLDLGEREAGEFAKLKFDLEANVKAIGKAGTIVRESAGEAFVQTSGASLVRSFAMERAELPSAICQERLFLFARLMYNTEKC
mmetsp:Transcript_19877/g.52060  ORF Transcript_19877/g.52060 Transcript_19877/m.52060 type:complete len:173 (-) Transcript_19877:1084-1602(-)